VARPPPTACTSAPRGSRSSCTPWATTSCKVWGGRGGQRGGSRRSRGSAGRRWPPLAPAGWCASARRRRRPALPWPWPSQPPAHSSAPGPAPGPARRPSAPPPPSPLPPQPPPGSHYDEYLYDWSSFKAGPVDPQVFEPPAICSAAPAEAGPGGRRSSLGAQLLRLLPASHVTSAPGASQFGALSRCGGGGWWGVAAPGAVQSSAAAPGRLGPPGRLVWVCHARG
jgi:hypothetical protein